MTVCEQCEGTEFEYIEGTNYCTICQTASTNLVYQNEDYDNMALYHKKVFKQSEAKSNKIIVERALRGRPWQTIEAFTVILRAQVDALVSLGADSKLEEVAFKIWTMYCKKNGSGFDRKNIPKTYVKGRDFDPGTIKDPFPRPLRFLSEYYNKDNSSKEFKQLSDSDASDSDVEKDKEFSHITGCTRRMTASERYHAYYTIGIMSMQKCLSILYLSLLYTNPTVQPYDLIYYVNTGQVPYTHNCFPYLPEDMVFGMGDHQTFLKQNVPKSATLRFYTGLIADYVGLDSLPHVSMVHLVSRYIVELNLPGEMHQCAHRLINRHPYTTEKTIHDYHKKAIPYSPVALAYIVVVLKLLFGLDDSTEKQLSTYAREIGNKINLATPLFIWDDWQLFIENKLCKKNSECLNSEVDFDDLNVNESLGLFHDLDTSNKPIRIDTNYKSDKHIYDKWILKIENPLKDIFMSKSQDQSTENVEDNNLKSKEVNQKTEMKTFTLAYITNEYFFEENKYLVKNGENLSDLPAKIDAASNYITNERNLVYRSKSIKWLIRSFSEHISCDIREMNKYVCVIENMLLTSEAKLPNVSKIRQFNYKKLRINKKPKLSKDTQ